MDMDKELEQVTRDREQAGYILVSLEDQLSVERTLHAAEGIARATGATLMLLYTIALRVSAEQVGPGAPSTQTYQYLLEDEVRAARDFLEGLARRLRQRGLDVRTRVECGDATAELFTMVEQLRPTLVVVAAPEPVTSDGGAQAKHPLCDSANQIVSRNAVPVLVVPTPECRAQAAFPAHGQQSKW